jgi:hypothetical protein
MDAADIRARLGDGKAVALGLYEGPTFLRLAVANDFDIEEAVLEGCRLLLAYYNYEDYSGEAFVLFEREGQLYEVNGSHCSCHGLEGQWRPEETSVTALRYRLDQGYEGVSYGKNVYADELRVVLEWFEGRQGNVEQPLE